jgi:hypothetical protein
MEEETVVKFPIPDDADDIANLFNPELGDAITETKFLTLVVGKPRDFYRTHPDKAYRQRTEIYTHKPEGVIDAQHYIIHPSMRGRIDEARPCVLVTVIDRTGTPRLWPIGLPREGERDMKAWESARIAARNGIDKWVKLLWQKQAYVTREAQAGYAPDPDWTKLPTYEELVRLGFGDNGVIRGTDHVIYRDLFGANPDTSTLDDI